MFARALETAITDATGMATALATTRALMNNIVRNESALRMNAALISGRFRPPGIADKVLRNAGRLRPAVRTSAHYRRSLGRRCHVVVGTKDSRPHSSGGSLKLVVT